MKTPICSMCRKFISEFIATETNEPLCSYCAKINEEIKRTNYPEKLTKFPLKPIKNDKQ